MALLKDVRYQPPWFLRNKHLNTVYPSIFRRVPKLNYQRYRLETPDQDFVDLDFSTVNSSTAVVIVHGLEGSSKAAYVKGMAKTVNRAGWDAIAMNLRGCSGTLNRLYASYHSGQTTDIDTVIRYLRFEWSYTRIILVGFSLGGNIVLKYAGEQGTNIPSVIQACIGLSVPCDLKASAFQLEKLGNQLYLKRFLYFLKQKVSAKLDRFPDAPITKNDLRQASNFKAFDDLYTAPAHGFKDAEDYWKQCSCKRVLENIRIPALLLNAQDDPFLPEAAYPYRKATSHPYFDLAVPKYGGHVGFVRDIFLRKSPWHESFVLHYLKKTVAVRLNTP